ncbi:molybdate ABC transporter substrate-binding protein [Nostoc sp. CENA67]|uniref:Molybdate ABC transporter substrate-binding protein n=1 Tax=Amazonocrinis nigriterrae CENA67 TaxID=2794033 RepID=A0A8J7HP11_9NOST|nr:molybdate ABC transporter substrate-binding protein [Amazonocrinis nigriterrae]MBH8560780.1 molybdate ABC transporter substrate-binding protein [Amazonocrinis nigriterrae CENA67]
MFFLAQRRRFLSWIAAAVASLALVIGLPLLTNPTTQTAQATTTLRVYAAVSLTEVLPEIESAYNTANPGSAINFINTFDSSGALLNQINLSSNESAGIPDIFISAATTQMNSLQSAGKLASGWPVTIATNRLVLIRPSTPTSPAPSPTISTFDTLTNCSTCSPARTGIRGIAIGDPATVPAGAYGQQVLQSTLSGCGAGSYNTLLNSTTANKLVFASNVRNVLTAVQNKTLSGNTIDAGIVYITDQAISSGTTQTALAAQSCHNAIVYPAAVLSRTTNLTAANSFANYLSSSTARSKFTNRGFGVP